MVRSLVSLPINADELSEATSALDGESEAHVQQALDNASKGR
jgi:ABC-type transport system involved in Fe-S cluster assembly fused permease/ATPase subunit